MLSWNRKHHEQHLKKTLVMMFLKFWLLVIFKSPLKNLTIIFFCVYNNFNIQQWSVNSSLFANNWRINLSQIYLLIFMSRIDSYFYSPQFLFMNNIPIREYINLTNIIPIHEYFSKYSWISYYYIKYIWRVWIYLTMDLFAR